MIIINNADFTRIMEILVENDINITVNGDIVSISEQGYENSDGEMVVPGNVILSFKFENTNKKVG